MEDRDDEALITELRGALETLDPVPDQVIEAAKASFAWRRVDEALADLVADTATQPAGPARSAGDSAEPRLLTFHGRGLTVEIEVTQLGDSRRLLGQLVPPRRAEVEVCWQGGSATSDADTIGLFSVSSVPAGPVSIICRPGAGQAQIVTSWITI